MSYIDQRRQFTIEVRAHIEPRIESLARALGIDGAKKGGRFHARNPRRDDRHAGSFVVWLANGAWKDWATGDRGDVFDLIAYIKGLTFAEAVDWAADFTGLRQMKPEVRQKALASYQQDKTQRQQDEEEKLLDGRKRAGDAWRRAEKRLLGTPVEAYVRARNKGSFLDEIATDAGAVRYEGITEYWPGREYDAAGTIIKRGPRFPTMILPILGPRHEIISAHRTFLRLDGRGKAPVSKQKLMFPRFDGLPHYIPIANGPSGLSAREACEQGVTDDICLVVEGIETGWAGAFACPGFRVVAAGSNTEFGNIPDFACVSAYLVAREPARSRGTAEASDRAIALLKSRTGKPVAILPAYVGGDLADTLHA